VSIKTDTKQRAGLFATPSIPKYKAQLSLTRRLKKYYFHFLVWITPINEMHAPNGIKDLEGRGFLLLKKIGEGCVLVNCMHECMPSQSKKKMHALYYGTSKKKLCPIFWNGGSINFDQYL
jgi:hypothetical protein